MIFKASFNLCHCDRLHVQYSVHSKLMFDLTTNESPHCSAAPAEPKLKATIRAKVDIHLCHRAVDTKAIFVGLQYNKYLCCHGDTDFIFPVLFGRLIPSRSFLMRLLNTVVCIKFSFDTYCIYIKI